MAYSCSIRCYRDCHHPDATSFLVFQLLGAGEGAAAGGGDDGGAAAAAAAAGAGAGAGAGASAGASAGGAGGAAGGDDGGTWEPVPAPAAHRVQGGGAMGAAWTAEAVNVEAKADGSAGSEVYWSLLDDDSIVDNLDASMLPQLPESVLEELCDNMNMC